MATLLFANNAQTTLAGSISNSDTSLAVAAGQGSLFPNPGPGDWFIITLTDIATRTDIEIMRVTDRVGDVFTVVRGQEGTAAQAWLAGDLVGNRPTAGQMEEMVQQGELQAAAGAYAQDTGAVNALVVALNPVLTAHVTGMPIRVRVLATNTGPSTLNPGPGAAAIQRNDGTALIGGELLINSIVTFIYDGASYKIAPLAGASNATTAAGTDTQSAVTPAGLASLFPLAITNGGTGTNDLPAVLAGEGRLTIPTNAGTVLLQWGTQTGLTSNEVRAVVFPVTFGSGPFTGMLTRVSPNNNGTGSPQGIPGLRDLTASGCNIYNGGNDQDNGSPATYRWMVLGGL